MARLITTTPVSIGGKISFSGAVIHFNEQRTLPPLPALYDAAGYYVNSVNLWFISLVSERILQDLSSCSRALLRYWRFLERTDIRWDFMPFSRADKPLYLFRNTDLLPAINNGDLAYSTASTYMGHIIQFYNWAVSNNLLKTDEEHAPFGVDIIHIQNPDEPGKFQRRSMTIPYDLRIRSPRKTNINGAASLNPLSLEELSLMFHQLPSTPVEFRLICTLALQSGLRLEEACGFTVDALFQAAPTSHLKNRYLIRIGPENGIPTKYSKTRKIEISASLLESLKEYVIQERRLRRLNALLNRRSGAPETNNTRCRFEPLFISQQGNPVTPAVFATRWAEFRTHLKTFVPTFRHKFHDLRCTYATLRLQHLLDAGLAPHEAMDLLMGWMGHNNEATTWKYLTYLRYETLLKDKFEMMDNIMHLTLKEPPGDK